MICSETSITQPSIHETVLTSQQMWLRWWCIIKFSRCSPRINHDDQPWSVLEAKRHGLGPSSAELPKFELNYLILRGQQGTFYIIFSLSPYDYLIFVTMFKADLVSQVSVGFVLAIRQRQLFKITHVVRPKITESIGEGTPQICWGVPN